MPAKTVLTTGANSGIGLATVLELARRGYHSVGSVRSEAKADAVAKAAADAGVRVDTVLMDVTDADRCAEVVEQLRPYGVVNNAGYSNFGAVEDVDDEEAREQFEAMVLAPIRLARLALPHMRAAKEGRIVNVSSVAGIVTWPFGGWYTATKHAIEALSDALRVEVAKDGVRVVLVEPGGFRTGIWEEAERDMQKRDGSRFMGAYRRSIQATKLAEPFMGNPQQCARVIANAVSSSRPRDRYLVGMDAQFITRAFNVTPAPVRDLAARLSLGL